MNQIFKKITPKHDLSWYIKWISSYILLIGMALTSLDIQPYNLFFHLVGVTGWFFVGMMWHDRALIFINAVAMFIFITGLLKEVV